MYRKGTAGDNSKELPLAKVGRTRMLCFEGDYPFCKSESIIDISE